MSIPEFFRRIEGNYYRNSDIGWFCIRRGNYILRVNLPFDYNKASGVGQVQVYLSTNMPHAFYCDDSNIEEVIDLLNLPIPELEAYLTALHRQNIT